MSKNYIIYTIIALVGIALGYIYSPTTPPNTTTPAEPNTAIVMQIGILEPAVFKYPQEGAFQITDETSNKIYRLKSQNKNLADYLGQKIAVTGDIIIFQNKNIINVNKIEVVDTMGAATSLIWQEYNLPDLLLYIETPSTWDITTSNTKQAIWQQNNQPILQIDSKPLSTTPSNLAKSLADFTPTQTSIRGTSSTALVIKTEKQIKVILPLETEKKLINITLYNTNQTLLNTILSKTKITIPTPIIQPSKSTWETTAIPLEPTEPLAIPEPEPISTTPQPNIDIPVFSFTDSYYTGWRSYQPRGQNYTAKIHKWWYYTGLNTNQPWTSMISAGKDKDPANKYNMRLGTVNKISQTGKQERIGNYLVWHNTSDNQEQFYWNIGEQSYYLQGDSKYLEILRATISAMKIIK